MKTLLLLIDLQQDFLAAAGLEPSAGAVVAQAAALLEAFRKSGLPVVHVHTTVSRDADQRMKHWRQQERWICEAGTPGHEPPAELKPCASEIVFHKTTFNAFADGQLDRQLRDQAAETLIVAGVHLHACVRQAVLHAYEQHEMNIWVAGDAVASDDPLHAAITRRYLEQRTIRFLPAREIIAYLEGADVPSSDRPRLQQSVKIAAARCSDMAVEWRARTPELRAGVFESLARQLQDQADQLAQSLALEIGKPVRYGVMEARRTAEMLRAIMHRVTSGTLAEKAGRTELFRRELGVVAVLTPWNNPLFIPLGKIVPALLFGNAVLWKPAPQALSTSRRLMEMFHDAGLPEGLLSLVEGGRHAGEAVMSDPGVDAVSLTGSLLAGHAAQEICARRHIPLQAELGGNNAAIVWLDADLHDAARQISDGAFAMTGQRCTANRRVIVHRSCLEKFRSRLVTETAALTWGDPRDPITKVGPLVNAMNSARIAALVARAAQQGCEVIVPHAAQGAAPGTGFAGAWHPPTIVCCEDPSLEIVQYESFGPVLVLQVADDLDHALRLNNEVPQGLVAALFSNDADVSAQFRSRAQAGILKFNQSTADAEVDVPFGGWKASGVGPPEHGIFDRDFYTRPQTCYPSPPPVAKK